MGNGFVKIRRGLEEHLVSGQLGFLEAGVYLVIHLQANYETGVWVGSAPRLLATAPRGTNLREVQRAMQRLTQIGFLKVFHAHGKRGNFRALINRYEPQFGALRGYRLNADASMSWRCPVYESCAEAALTSRSDRAETVAEDGTEAAPYPEVEVEKTKRDDDDSARSPQIDTEHYNNRIDQFREQVLLKFKGRATDSFLTAAMDVIDQRAHDNGTRIGSAKYLETALSNFLESEEEMATLADELSRKHERRERWMPGFNEHEHSDAPDPELTADILRETRAKVGGIT